MTRRLRRVARTVLMLLVAALLGITVAVTPAQAATYRYDGQNPQTTGCANTAFNRAVGFLRYNGTVYGKVELRFSRACQTAWTRIQLSDPDILAPTFAFVRRRSDLKRYDCENLGYVPSLGTWSCYTAMVYDGGSLKADGYGYLTVPYPSGSGRASMSTYAREP